MRTTLPIDDDILAAAKDLPGSQQKTVGAVLSSLARKGLMRLCQPQRRETAFRSSRSSPVRESRRRN